MSKLVNKLVFPTLISLFMFNSANAAIDTVIERAGFSRQDIFNQEQQENYIEFKSNQNVLPDAKRKKNLRKNEYWLVNKEQDLWMGIFDGKYVKVPGGTYIGIPRETFLPEQLIRVRKGSKTSQFLLTDSIKGYPQNCYNRHDQILIDSSDYTVFYTSCGYKKSN